MRFWRDFVVVGVIALALIVGLAYWASSATCSRIGTQVERPTEFYMFGGCFVELNDGRSVPIDENSIGLFLEER